MSYIFLPLMRYFELRGRSTRREFWSFLIAVTAICFGLIVYIYGRYEGHIATIAMIADDPDLGSEVGRLLLEIVFSTPGIVLISVSLFTLIPGITVTVRRLHDMGFSGWWVVAGSIAGALPLVGWIATLAFYGFLLMPGTKGDNKFGPDPRDFTFAELAA